MKIQSGNCQFGASISSEVLDLVKVSYFEMSFWHPQFSQKTNEKIQIYYYYDTSSRFVFTHFLGELKTLRRYFEIN